MSKLSEAYDEGRDAAKSRFSAITSKLPNPLTLLGLGLASHVGSNAAVKALSSTRLGTRMGSAAMASGIRRGLEGQQLGHGVARVAKTLIGPEAVVGHDIGQQLGQGLAHLPHELRGPALKELRNRLAKDKSLRNAPHVDSLLGAVDHVLTNPTQGAVGKALSSPAGSAPSMASRLGAAAALGGVAVAEPSAIVHMGVNAARERMAHSELGQQFMLDQFHRGLHNAPLPRGVETATDLLLSPKALDTRRMGVAMGNAARERGISDPGGTADALHAHLRDALLRAYG